MNEVSCDAPFWWKRTYQYQGYIRQKEFVLPNHPYGTPSIQSFSLADMEYTHLNLPPLEV
jgi:hypothetical protein